MEVIPSLKGVVNKKGGLFPLGIDGDAGKPMFQKSGRGEGWR